MVWLLPKKWSPEPGKGKEEEDTQWMENKSLINFAIMNNSNNKNNRKEGDFPLASVKEFSKI